MVGEWGAFNKTPHDVSLRWAEDCLSNWQKAGWGWALWNFRGSFGILDSGRTDVQYEDSPGINSTGSFWSCCNDIEGGYGMAAVFEKLIGAYEFSQMPASLNGSRQDLVRGVISGGGWSSLPALLSVRSIVLIG